MMKKLIVVTTLLLSLVLMASAFAAEQTGNLKGMTNQQQTTKGCCRMSAEKLQQMQAVSSPFLLMAMVSGAAQPREMTSAICRATSRKITATP